MSGGDRTVLVVESLDHEGKGVAHCEGKVVFVEGALPGEVVAARVHRRKAAYDTAVTEEVLTASSQRVSPGCPHFGVCGGCSMQHLAPGAQLASKQRVLEDCLRRIGGTFPEVILPAIAGPTWQYRHRARLSVRNVVKKGGVLVGFHERRSSYVAEMKECPVLPERISRLIVPLRDLVGRLDIRDRLPQIEVALGDTMDVLVLRVLAPPSPNDEAHLRAFADRHGVWIALQPKGPDTVSPFHPLPWPDLEYSLPEFDLRFRFSPTEFTQVNSAVNRVLVRRAISLLDPRQGERIADLFCGLGNFSLPIARRGANVIGIEGSQALVERAGENARRNGLGQSAGFRVMDLFKISPEFMSELGPVDAMLIDPPRDGAIEVVKALGAAPPRRVVYVSCNPATLARDAGVLANVHGYRFRCAGIANMFPHTAHVESIALFERPD